MSGARDVYARHMQQVLGEAYDNDFSHLSVAETIDSIEYHLFPNAFFFPGLQIPLCYRFRPDGPDPDKCIYEVLYLRPKPRSGKVPEPAAPFDLDVDDSYTTVPGLPTSLGQVLDQDTTNLAAQTRGFKSSKKRGQTLGNYQEVRARHLQDMVRRYIAEGRASADTSSSEPASVITESITSESGSSHMNNAGSAESRIAVSDLVHHYADAVCRRDADQWAGTWAPDAVWELGKGRRVEGREAILELWNSAMDGFKAVVQNVVNNGASLDDASGSGIGSLLHPGELVACRRLEGHPPRLLRRRLRTRSATNGSSRVVS